jgi:carbamoyl-phosphate synthase large subunit
MPFCSKSVGYNIIKVGLKGIFESFDFEEEFFEPIHKAFAVKTPQFSWGRLRDSYPFLGPEMKSTGESAALGKELHEALLKSWLGASPNKIPNKSALVYGLTNIDDLEKCAKKLSKNIDIYSIEEAPIKNTKVIKKEEAINSLINNKIDILITDNYIKQIDYNLRRIAVNLNIPLVLNAKLGNELAEAFSRYQNFEILELKKYWENLYL